MKRFDQFLCLPKVWVNWAETWRLRMVGEAAQSPTGSDLMSKKTWACFCSVSFLLCSDRDFLSPVRMDTGVIRPSIPPTPNHPQLTEISFYCHAIPTKKPSNSWRSQRACACMFVFMKLARRGGHYNLGIYETISQNIRWVIVNSTVRGYIFWPRKYQVKRLEAKRKGTLHSSLQLCVNWHPHPCECV